jgi:hypothetical protein
VFYLLHKKYINIAEDLRNFLAIFKKAIFENKRTLLAGIWLFVFFFCFYFTASFLLSQINFFKLDDVVFEIDFLRAINDIVSFSAEHGRTSVHPLYVLIINPLGCFLKVLFHSDIVAAMLINSFYGAFAVLFVFLIFFLFGRDHVNSILLSCLFGFSMSQLVSSTLPHTSSLATFTLLLTYTLFLVSLKEKKLFFWVWVLAGILSFGITATNIMQTLICFGVCVFVTKRNEKIKLSLWSSFFSFIFLVVIISALLSIIQKIVYPSSRLFFLPKSYLDELQYASSLIVHQPFLVTAQILKHFFLVNIVSPKLSVFTLAGYSAPAVTLSNSGEYYLIGWVAVLLWLFVFLKGILKMYMNINRELFFYIGIFLSLAFNFVFHASYGIAEKGRIELLSYTGNFTFLVLLLLAGYSFSNKISEKAILAGLVILTFCNNIYIMKQLLFIYM